MINKCQVIVNVYYCRVGLPDPAGGPRRFQVLRPGDDRSAAFRLSAPRGTRDEHLEVRMRRDGQMGGTQAERFGRKSLESKLRKRRKMICYLKIRARRRVKAVRSFVPMRTWRMIYDKEEVENKVILGLNRPAANFYIIFLREKR